MKSGSRREFDYDRNYDLNHDNHIDAFEQDMREMEEEWENEQIREQIRRERADGGNHGRQVSGTEMAIIWVLTIIIALTFLIVSIW